MKFGSKAGMRWLSNNALLLRWLSSPSCGRLRFESQSRHALVAKLCTGSSPAKHWEINVHVTNLHEWSLKPWALMPSIGQKRWNTNSSQTNLRHCYAWVGVQGVVCGVLRPTREFFIHIDTYPLPVKGCKFSPTYMLDSHSH